VLQAQGWHGFDNITSSGASRGRWHCGLREDDDTTGPGTVRVNGITGLGTTPGAQYHGPREDNVVVGSGIASQAWGWRLRGQRCHRLGSRKMAVHKWARPWLGTTTLRLRGRFNDGVEALGGDSMMA
jgi:hypothetical protein